MLHTTDTKKWSDHDSLSQENYTLGSQIIEKSLYFVLYPVLQLVCEFLRQWQTSTAFSNF